MRAAESQRLYHLYSLIGQAGSRGRVPRGAVGFALVLGQKFAVDDFPEGSRPLLPLGHGGDLRWRLQVLQVVVGLAHARILPLVPPPEEQLGALVQETAYKGQQRERSDAGTRVLDSRPKAEPRWRSNEILFNTDLTALPPKPEVPNPQYRPLRP